MKSKERVESIVAQAVILAAIAAIIIVIAGAYRDKKITSEKDAGESVVTEFTLWYTDMSYEAYLNEAALRYEEQTGIKVNIVYHTGIDYLEDISEANTSGTAPDLFMASEENMQKLVYMGLVMQNYDDSIVNDDNYYEKSIKSITFNGKQYGYPMGFETSVMAVNMQYTDTLPTSFDDIKAFADGFNSEEDEAYLNVESILKWDVRHIEYSYGFLGAYLNVGGEYGDDISICDVDNENAVAAGNYFYSIAGYFYMDTDNISYEDILDDFISGKIVYAIVDAKIIERLAESDVNAELITFPNLTDELEARELSSTAILFVNPFGENKNEASDFAEFVSYEMADEMYDITKSVISARRAAYENEYLNSFTKAYEQSVGMIKLMNISDYWIKAEAIMQKIWSGSDSKETLEAFKEELSQRIN